MTTSDGAPGDLRPRGTSTAPALARALPYACLILLAAAHVGLSGWWMRECGFFSPRPPYQDAAPWRAQSLELLEAWRTGGFLAWVGAGLAHDQPHPPLLVMLASLTSLPEGQVTVESQWRVEMIFLVLMVAVSYRLARNFGGRWFSVLAAAAMTSAPVVLTMARWFYPKMPMTVMVIAALDALLRSRAFTRRGWSIAFGVLSGIATLTFMLAPLYLVGSALFAAALAAARSPLRRVRLANVALALLAFLWVASVWYAAHWRRTYEYVAAVTGSAGQQAFSKGVPLWAPARWLYYPLALVNRGLGFFVAAWVVGALLGRAAAALRKVKSLAPWESGHLPGWTLAAGAIVSFLCVVPGQTAGDAEYVMNLAPLGLLFVAVTLRLVPGAWLRTVLAVLFAATCAFTVALVHRRFDEDVTRLRLGPFEVIGAYDRYGGAVARLHGCLARPEGETWPNEEFVDVMIWNAWTQDLRFGQLLPYMHNYVHFGNLEYAGHQRGVRLRAVNLSPASVADPAKIASFLEETDFLVVDHPFSDPGDEARLLPEVLEEAAASGITIDNIARRRVTERSELTLYQVSRPWDPDVVPASALEEGRVVKMEALFDNGWKLVGVEIAEAPGGGALLHTFWDLGAPGRPGFELFVDVFEQRQPVARGRAPFGWFDPPKEGGPWLARVSARVSLALDDPKLKVRLGLRLEGKGRSAADHSNNLASTVPRFGSFRITVKE